MTDDESIVEGAKAMQETAKAIGYPTLHLENQSLRRRSNRPKIDPYGT